MNTHDFACYVVAPGGLRNLSLVASACRSGAIGIVDLHDQRDFSTTIEDVEPVRLCSGGGLGVRIDGSDEASWSSWIAELPAEFGTVILSASSPEALVEQTRRLHEQKRTVLLEATSLDEAQAGEKAGVDAIIAKGNEAAGRISEQTTFILLQRIVPKVDLPVYAQGGVGLHTAAGCWAAGARGVVLDWQLALVNESALPKALKTRISHLDGRESRCFGQLLDDRHRLFVPGGPKGALKLEDVEHELERQPAGPQRLAKWRRFLHERMTGDESTRALPLSQDVAFAARFAREFHSVHGVLSAMRAQVRSNIELGREHRPLGEGRGSAQIMGTRYPIIQGPMSRVSDTPAFAAAVAEEGAMPVLAVAAMAPEELEPMLQQTSELLAGRPYGVGLLGFLDKTFLGKQVELVKKFPPAIAVVAGGTPAQAAELAEAGIRAYIHVPSIRLLVHYIQDGARSFIFEGRECGGHIGPFAASVLWENAVDCLLANIPEDKASEYDIWFAGGIHDEVSAGMVAAIAAPLAARGVRVGVLLATAYLFTEEAVKAGAIGEVFQAGIVEAEHTDILDSGGGYEVRSAPSPFSRNFAEEKIRLRKEGKSFEEVRDALELLNLGRLRIAAKGVAFNVKSLEDPSLPMTLEVSAETQKEDGCFMAGQVVSLRHDIATVKDLHESLSVGAMARLDAIELPADAPVPIEVRDNQAACEVAIIGMAGIFPQAGDLRTYWNNVLNGVYAITEIPKKRWDANLYYDPDPTKRDKIYSKWGGFIDPIVFDPTKFAIPPLAVKSIDPLQLFPLEVVRRTLEDAGYADRSFQRDRTATIFGVSGGMGDLGLMYGVRSVLPLMFEDPPEELLDQMPEWTEDSFPGVLANVVAGRIANTFDFGGPNFTVDAACGSGLTAIYTGVREITTGTCDTAIVGASDVMQNPFGFLSFSKSRALSKNGRPRPFDAEADGICIAEGVAAVFLKRRDLAERDGDRIYAVIRGVGAGSDGRGASMTAPQNQGQQRAFDRAYREAGFSPDTVELIEAHGTGTTLGDGVEATSIHHLLEGAGAKPKTCAVGSVKSMIGHTKGCAGIASIIKASLALYHKVLPATLGVTRPAPEQVWGEDSPIYVNTETRPWVGQGNGTPRRAGVDAFGFGGSNFHAIVEEYTPPSAAPVSCPLDDWPCELFWWTAESVSALRTQIDSLRGKIATDTGAKLRELASVMNENALRRFAGAEEPSTRLTLVADSLGDLRAKLATADGLLASGKEEIYDPRGIYASARPRQAGERVAFLFPGQASQRPDMLRDLATLFPEFRERMSVADRTIGDRLPKRLSEYLYPPPRFSQAEEDHGMAELTSTDVAQTALATVEFGLFKLMELFGVKADMMAGHSAGEYTGLCAAGVITEAEMYDLLIERGRSMLKSASDDPSTMLAVNAHWDAIKDTVTDLSDVYPANLNSPAQTILSGRTETLRTVAERLSKQEIRTKLIAVSCGFHSPFVSNGADLFRGKLGDSVFRPPHTSVYANLTATPYPADEAGIRALLSDHIDRPVRWADEVNAMYEDGARIFIELGPGNVLTNLLRDILTGRPYVAAACDSKADAHDLPQLLRVLAILLAQGLPVDPRPLFERRHIRPLDKTSMKPPAPDPHSSVSWMLSPDQVWPISEQRRQLKRVSLQVPSPTQPAAATTPTPTASGAAPGAMQMDAMVRYQKLMSQMIEQQKDVMLAFLGSAAPAGTLPTPTPEPTLMQTPTLPRTFPTTADTPAAPVLTTAPAPIPEPVSPSTPTPSRTDVDLEKTLVDLVSERTGYPPEMLDLNLDLEADLGIDSIKRVEILTALGKALPDAPATLLEEAGGAKTLRQVLEAVSSGVPAAAPATPVPTSDTGVGSSREELTRTLVELVAERTGYPPEMLDLDLDLEADLGIDSIKRVEILTAFDKAIPDAPATLAEQVGSAKTLRHVLDAVLSAPAPAPEFADTADATPSTEDSLTAESLTATLIELVAERTGYPPEMLDLDLDLEADLGIDSIKRVEILTAFGKSLPNIPAQMTEDAGTAKTLREVVDAVLRQFSQEVPPVAAANAGPDTEPGVQRYLVKLKQAPLESEGDLEVPAGVVLITDDGKGTAPALRNRIVAAGGQAVVVSHSTGSAKSGDEILYRNLANAEMVEALITELRATYGKIGGILHLLTLRDAPTFESLTIDEWQALLDAEIKSLFYLLHYAAPDLSGEGRRWVMACSTLGPAPDNGMLPKPSFPWRGGLMGLLKSVAMEWPNALCRVVDIDQAPPVELCAKILRELSHSDESHEVYYRKNVRWVTKVTEAPLKQQESENVLDRDSVVLAVGGARGITAEVLREIASRYQPNLILSGRSPWPKKESSTTADVESPTELRRILFKVMSADGTAPRPIEVEKVCRRILMNREMIATRAALEKMGARVAYIQADAGDPNDVASLLAQIEQTYGRLDGVINGAGIIEDKLLQDKTPESFSRVFDVKARSVYALSQLLKYDKLKFLVLFSSVAGWFGNRGQSDYAAASEVLNRTAMYLCGQWQRRVVAVNWGPWASAGMATKEVQAQFSARGLEMVDPGAGSRYLMDEISHGSLSDSIVIAVGAAS